MTSMRRRYVASTSLRRHVPTRFLINQCQIITVLILKSDIIENSRIDLRGIVLPVQVGGLLGGGGGGGQRVCWPPSQIIGHFSKVDIFVNSYFPPLTIKTFQNGVYS